MIMESNHGGERTDGVRGDTGPQRKAKAHISARLDSRYVHAMRRVQLIPWSHSIRRQMRQMGLDTNRAGALQWSLSASLAEVLRDELADAGILATDAPVLDAFAHVDSLPLAHPIRQQMNRMHLPSNKRGALAWAIYGSPAALLVDILIAAGHLAAESN